jgi:hypothetical protein
MTPQYARVLGKEPTKSELRAHIGIDAHQFLQANSPTKGLGDYLTIIIRDYAHRQALHDKLDRVELLVRQLIDEKKHAHS